MWLKVVGGLAIIVSLYLLKISYVAIAYRRVVNRSIRGFKSHPLYLSNSLRFRILVNEFEQAAHDGNFDLATARSNQLTELVRQWHRDQTPVEYRGLYDEFMAGRLTLDECEDRMREMSVAKAVAMFKTRRGAET